MTAKNIPVAQARQEFDIHARGDEYLSLAAWKSSAQVRIQIFTSVILATATGDAERRQFGNSTIALDPEAIAAITAAIGQMQKAITGSTVVWLPGAEEVQERLPAARHDLSFQGFLKTLDEAVGSNKHA